MTTSDPFPQHGSEAPIHALSAVPGVADPASFWPTSLAHLAMPYDVAGGEYVTIAEISEAAVGGFDGYRKVTVALVPLTTISEVLESTAETGHEVHSHGPLPIVDDDGPPHQSGFWIDGIQREDHLHQVSLRRHHRIDVLVGRGRLVDHLGILAALDAVRG